MSRKGDTLVLVDNLDQPKRSVEQVAADLAAVLRAGPSPGLCRELANMIDPKGRPITGWSLKLQRRKRRDDRSGILMAALVDDEGMSVKAAMDRVRQKFSEEENSNSTLFAALKREREFRRLSELVDKAGKPAPK